MKKALLALACAAVSSAAVAVTFSDTEFVTSDYDLNPLPGGTLSLTTDQWAGGNPGNAFRNAITVGTGNGNYQMSAMNTTFVYDPSVSGAIASISFSLDYLRQRAGGGAGSINMPLNMWMLARQDGKLYQASSDFYGANPAAGVYQTYSRAGITQAGFNGYEIGLGFNANEIDFSATGSAITFGFFLGSGYQNNGAADLEIEEGIDNFSVEVEAVPEPMTLGLLGLGALVGLRRRAVK